MLPLPGFGRKSQVDGPGSFTTKPAWYGSLWKTAAHRALTTTGTSTTSPWASFIMKTNSPFGVTVKSMASSFNTLTTVTVAKTGTTGAIGNAEFGGSGGGVDGALGGGNAVDPPGEYVLLPGLLVGREGGLVVGPVEYGAGGTEAGVAYSIVASSRLSRSW